MKRDTVEPYTIRARLNSIPFVFKFMRYYLKLLILLGIFLFNFPQLSSYQKHHVKQVKDTSETITLVTNILTLASLLPNIGLPGIRIETNVQSPENEPPHSSLLGLSVLISTASTIILLKLIQHINETCQAALECYSILTKINHIIIKTVETAILTEKNSNAIKASFVMNLEQASLEYAAAHFIKILDAQYHRFLRRFLRIITQSIISATIAYLHNLNNQDILVSTLNSFLTSLAHELGGELVAQEYIHHNHALDCQDNKSSPMPSF